MTSTGTFAYNPAAYDLMLQAFARCGIRPAGLTSEHLATAATACNLLQVEWSNRQVNLWTVDLQSIPLIQGTATYNVSAATVMILAAYIETQSGTDPAIDRIITSINAEDYAAYPDKTTQGQPTVYWFNTQISPVITMWQTPDDGGPYTLKFYRARQLQDASFVNATTPEIPYRFLEAYTAGLAVRLAEMWAPERVEMLTARSIAAWREASARDVANVPLRIVPGLGAITNSVY